MSVEIFAWGKYGGFGRATRTVGRELVRRGIKVSAIVPRRPGQAEQEDLDGIEVLAFPPQQPWRVGELCRRCDAQIFHSQEPSWATRGAMRAAPHRKHLVTFRDPRTLRDWVMELGRPSASRLQVLANLLYEDNPAVRSAVRRADGVFCAAEHLRSKAHRKYRLSDPPAFLPTPVSVPEVVEKASEPTVCYNGRWDRRKRPELFFELARAIPEVRFLAVGKSRDPAWEESLRARYEHLPNLEMVGFIDQFAEPEAWSRILATSWVMVGTATREGLPNAFLEAAAYRCAILSFVDPDGFASRFGHHAADEGFEAGLRSLLENDRWRRLGDRGRRHVQEHFETSVAIERHLDAYEQALAS